MTERRWPNMHYLGIDLRKHNAQFVLQNKTGETIYNRRIPTHKGNVQNLLHETSKPFKAVLEATRNWYWFYDLVEEEAEKVKFSHPIKTCLIAEARIKTDKLDAKILASLLQIDSLLCAR